MLRIFDFRRWRRNFAVFYRLVRARCWGLERWGVVERAGVTAALHRTQKIRAADLFNRLKKDELDLNIMGQLIVLLKMIEDEKIDQHTASFEVGKLLKSIYIDSALKKSQHLDEKHKHHGNDSKKHLPDKKISWAEYKKTML